MPMRLPDFLNALEMNLSLQCQEDRDRLRNYIRALRNSLRVRFVSMNKNVRKFTLPFFYEGEVARFTFNKRVYSIESAGIVQIDKSQITVYLRKYEKNKYIIEVDDIKREFKDDTDFYKFMEENDLTWKSRGTFHIYKINNNMPGYLIGKIDTLNDLRNKMNSILEPLLERAIIYGGINETARELNRPRRNNDMRPDSSLSIADIMSRYSPRFREPSFISLNDEEDNEG